MCNNFRGISQPKCGAVNELVDEFWRKVGLSYAQKLEVMAARLIPVQQTHPQSAQSDRVHIPRRLRGG